MIYSVFRNMTEPFSLVIKRIICSINSKIFYCLSAKQLRNKKFLTTLTEAVVKVNSGIGFKAELFLSKADSHIALSIMNLWEEEVYDSKPYEVKIPVIWKCFQAENNVISVCMALKDALYKFFREGEQTLSLSDWEETAFVSSDKVIVSIF